MKLRTLVLAGVFASAVQTASAAVFLFIPGVPGESVDQAHPAWIDLNSMSIGVANRICGGVVVTKNLDKASPVLSSAALTGGAYQSMTIEVTTGGEVPQTFLTYVLNTVVVASVATSVSAGVAESVTFQPTSLTMTYTPQGGQAVSFTQPCPKAK